MKNFMIFVKDLSLFTGAVLLIYKTIDEIKRRKVDYEVYKHNSKCKMREREHKCNSYCNGNKKD